MPVHQSPPTTHETIVLGGGCFWCTEAVFQRLKGVIEVIPGYAGGTVDNPNYEQVCTGQTGHAEVIKVSFDPDQIELKLLLEVFFATHDPTTKDSQGNDRGTQYRSIILYTSVYQKKEIDSFILQLTAERRFPQPIITEVKALDTFYPAEHYHQAYYNNHQNQPYCHLVIDPKITKLLKQFPNQV